MKGRAADEPVLGSAVIDNGDEVKARYVHLAAAAAVVLLVVVAVPLLALAWLHSGARSHDQLATSPVSPIPSLFVPASVPTMTPPAPLSVSVSVSATTVPYGGHITVSYRWSDGNGRALAVNSVTSGAVRTVRPPACGGATAPVRSRHGHGSFVFTPDYPEDGVQIDAGPRAPFVAPQRIKVGVEVTTGGRCIPVEDKTVTVWVTMLPPPAPEPPSR